MNYRAVLVTRGPQFESPSSVKFLLNNICKFTLFLLICRTGSWAGTSRWPQPLLPWPELFRSASRHSSSRFRRSRIMRSGSEWRDLTKLCHFGTIIKVLGKFLKVYLVFGKMLILLWQKCYAVGQVFIVVDSNIL